MPTMTEILPARKSSPASAINWTPDMQCVGRGRLTIHTARCSCQYDVTRFPTDFAGTAFHFQKVTAGSDQESEGCDVFIGRGERICDCKGFTRWGACKHLDAAEAIIENGWDTMSLVNPEADVASTERPF